MDATLRAFPLPAVPLRPSAKHETSFWGVLCLFGRLASKAETRLELSFFPSEVRWIYQIIFDGVSLILQDQPFRPPASCRVLFCAINPLVRLGFGLSDHMCPSPGVVVSPNIQNQTSRSDLSRPLKTKLTTRGKCAFFRISSLLGAHAGRPATCILSRRNIPGCSSHAFACSWTNRGMARGRSASTTHRQRMRMRWCISGIHTTEDAESNSLLEKEK